MNPSRIPELSTAMNACVELMAGFQITGQNASDKAAVRAAHVVMTARRD